MSGLERQQGVPQRFVGIVMVYRGAIGSADRSARIRE
jgi:hypothetical protein